ncbi:MAG: lipocalin family protein, partial [Acidobacteriota bacterium]|nr:lipocalin family protein [Acidobacteriota bacterium]
PYSAGTFVDKAGKAHHLTARDFELLPDEYWSSPKTGAHYPVSWRIRVPSLHIDMTCRAELSNQELVTSSGRNSYWEGAVVYIGTQAGRGYLEMTGYDKPISFE